MSSANNVYVNFLVCLYMVGMAKKLYSYQSNICFLHFLLFSAQASFKIAADILFFFSMKM